MIYNNMIYKIKQIKENHKIVNIIKADNEHKSIF